MPLTDSELMKAAAEKRLNAPAKTMPRYKDKQKIEAVTTFLMLGGSISLTAATTKIPEPTLFNWKRTEWWKDLVNEIKQEERLVLSSKLKRVMEKSWDVVADRLEHGDFIYDQKAGELRRKPVSLKDAAKVAADTSVIREKLDKNENFTVATEQIDDKLNKLARAFTDLAKGIKPPEPAEDIPFVEEHQEPDEQ